jgi:hypothetical protein
MLNTCFSFFALLCMPAFASAQDLWSKVPLPGEHPEVFALATHGDGQLFIGTGGLPNSAAVAVGVLSSADHGETVQARSVGIAETRFDRLFRALHSDGGVLVGASADGTYFSEDHGATWEKRAKGLPVVPQTGMRSANALASLDGKIFCGTPAGVYRTTDRGGQWTDSSEGLTTRDVRALARLDDLLFASTDGGGVFRSSDGGATWESASSGIPSGLHSRAIVGGDGVILAGTTQGTWRSLDKGETWQPSLATANARSFARSGKLLALGAFRGQGSVYVSVDHGAGWFDVTGNLPKGGIGVWAMAFDDEYLYAAVNRQGLWRLSRKSLTEALRSQRPIVASSATSGGPDSAVSADPLMAALDTDGNGELSSEEIAAAAAALRTLDRNQDGKISAVELGRSPEGTADARRAPGGSPAGRGGGAGGLLGTLMAFDTDGDGKLTKAEVPQRMQRVFDRADSNGDDVLDQKELEAFAGQVGRGRGR